MRLGILVGLAMMTLATLALAQNKDLNFQQAQMVLIKKTVLSTKNEPLIIYDQRAALISSEGTSYAVDCDQAKLINASSESENYRFQSQGQCFELMANVEFVISDRSLNPQEAHDLACAISINLDETHHQILNYQIEQK